MPNTREKLIELLINMPDFMMGAEGLADHLIANGVAISKMETVATDNSKWIPVTESLPENSVTFVVVADSKYGMPMRVVRRDSIMSHEFMGKHYGCFSQGVQITHWMPLPEPPKGE